MRWVAAAVASWVLLLWMLIAPAGPFRGPRPAPFNPPPHLEEASLRYGVWLAAIRVNQFAGRMHRLPVDLDEAGIADRSLRMERGSGPNDYTVTGTSGTATVTHRSGESLDALLGDSLELLAGRF